MERYERKVPQQELTEEIRGWLEEFADALADDAQRESNERLDVPTIRTRVARHLVEMYDKNIIDKSCRGISIAKGSQPVLEWTEDMNAMVFGLKENGDWIGPKFVIPSSEVLFPKTKN